MQAAMQCFNVHPNQIKNTYNLIYHLGLCMYGWTKTMATMVFERHINWIQLKCTSIVQAVRIVLFFASLAGFAQVMKQTKTLTASCAKTLSCEDLTGCDSPIHHVDQQVQAEQRDPR